MSGGYVAAGKTGTVVWVSDSPFGSLVPHLCVVTDKLLDSYAQYGPAKPLGRQVEEALAGHGTWDRQRVEDELVLAGVLTRRFATAFPSPLLRWAAVAQAAAHTEQNCWVWRSRADGARRRNQARERELRLLAEVGLDRDPVLAFRCAAELVTGRGTDVADLLAAAGVEGHWAALTQATLLVAPHLGEPGRSGGPAYAPPTPAQLVAVLTGLLD